MVLKDKTTLVLGASPKPERFSNEAVMELRKFNIPVIAVGKREANIGDIRIRTGMPHDIRKIHTITLYLSPKNQKEYYSYILSLNPSRIIFNPGTVNPELAGMAQNIGIKVVNECILVMLDKGTF